MKRSGKRHNANFKLHQDQSNIIRDLLGHLSPCPKNDYLRDHAFSKFVSSDTAPSVVRRARAINKWLATEKNNEATNERLLMVDPEYNILPRVTYSAFMRKVVDITTGIIGEIPPDVSDLGRFSGGASTSRSRASSHPSMKFTGEADVTERCREIGEDLIGTSSQDLWVRLRGSNELTTVDGNVLFVVPKNSDIDRCACKEPDINMYLQLGAGRFIRSALRREGINLNDQQVNNDLAREGSITGDLATLDLSSASDSITREFVFQSIPIFWFTLLDSLRCHITTIDGEKHVNEMFSSMGNGFTFELESLLFYAVAKAVAYVTGTPGRISVYGDDLIVPTQMSHDLIFVLQFLGFGVNEDKSFVEGPIRESCGGHYYNGATITPFYVRKPIITLIDCIHIANQLRLWSRSTSGILDEETEAVWLSLASMVPKRFWGGHDHGSPYRLVSVWQPDNPCSLVPMRDTEDTGVGGYLHFLDSRRTVTGSSGNIDKGVSPRPSGAGFDILSTTHQSFRTKTVRHGPGDNWSYPIEIYSDVWAVSPGTPTV
ncbi:TPA_asm: RNA-directed RNA polymerase [ssRNA phage SRR7976300_3]|uniref:RNA-directed RNA polymerase n=1 Tax=ssRNA phage SRR7976300_3 TaxID=2786652 RepID=A0A8S5L0G8_9VIRU|nr:RNA-directed RNA polymerase [ssRNA phage SRR7976300_3]DAD51104.1 TPA_asm: RNA-directed RNA polymerase [ssRNA phage SRR7976300_3]